MVSQSQDAMGWDGNGSPSRTGSLLSLDGRQRPAPAKTPPSYYDAVRSRHSLSQPRPSDGNKQDKGHPGQQVKYNSLPRPLPQRYPPTTANGHPPQQQHRPWPDDPSRVNNNNNNGSWRPPGDPAARLYDSPPKPANHVPLQLQLHTAQDRYLLKRGGPEQAEGAPRANGGGPRADSRLTVDCGGARGGSMEMMRKDSVRSLPPCSPDARSPPAVPPGRIAHPRMPPSHGEHSTNSLQRRDLNQAPGLLRRCTMSPDGSPVAPSNYPPRMPANGLICEPRYSKSGKMCTRPLSQGFESRPMPPPAVQLRTGRLGIYDAETLKRSEMANGGRSSYDDFNNNSRQTPQRAAGDISQQIYVDTNSSFAGGSTIVATADHLAIPYRIPQLSPKAAFDGCNGMEGRKDAPPGVAGRGHPPPPVLPNGVHHNQQQHSRSLEDHHLADHRNRRFHDTVQYSDGLQPYAGQGSNHAYKKHPPPSPDAIYANHLVPNGLNGHGPSTDHRSVQKRSPSMLNGNASAFYENHVPKNGPRDVQDVDTALYANQRVASTRYKSPQPEIASPVFPNGGENSFSNFRSPGHGSSQKSGNQHLPPPPQKPRPTLPQPSDMIMVTETRGWNGQASSYPAKDVVVKPTPRMPPRFAANIASGTQLTAVPAYQCVINELSGQNGHQTLPRNPSSDSSTLSLRSGYDSSSSSVRDFGRQPSKSDSSIDMRKLSEGGLKSAGSQQRIDKNFLSASMTSLCSDTSSSISTRRYHRYHHDDPNWDRMNEEYNKRKDKGSVFSASPWEREEKEKLQREQLLDARKARDQEIALLEAMPDRSEKQEEWLRILRLEREFQRRAEQEDDDEEEEEDDDAISHQEKQVRGGGEENGTVESFHGDKVNSIPNERLGRKLLDELHEDSSKSPTDKQEFSRSPSEKHFIPLERTISGSFTQGLSLPIGINSGQTPDQKHSEQSAGRLQKPPIPAPRPSKTPVSLKSDANSSDPCQVFDSDAYVYQSEPVPKAMESNVRNLAKIDISDSGFYRGSDEIGRRDCLQDNNWLIEVTSFENGSVPESPPPKQNGDHREESRIYENIMEFQHGGSQGRQNHPPPPSHNGYGSHTLPKPNSQLSAAKDVPRSPKGHPEKKFPAMGLTSTLSRKLNGHIPSDSDILPALYASSKVKNGYQKDIPSELEDKSPEFKKLWISKPEKLTFQDKIRKFSLQAGEDDVPRDRVKNSRAQREIEIKFNEGQKKSASTSSEA